MTKTLAVAADSSDAILDAAALLFRRHGYAATSVRDLARAAGILPGSLHYRYPSKEDVLVALMERAIDRLIAAILDAISGEVDPLERVRLAIRAHLRMVLSGENGVYVLLYDWRSLSTATAQAVERQRARYERFSDELISQAAAAAPVRPSVDLLLLRRFGFGAVNWVAQWFDPRDGYTVDDIADHFWRYLAFGALESGSPPRVRKEETRARTRRSTQPR